MNPKANLLLTAYIAVRNCYAVFIVDLVFGIFVYLMRENKNEKYNEEYECQRVKVMKFIDNDTDFVRI